MPKIIFSSKVCCYSIKSINFAKFFYVEVHKRVDIAANPLS